MFHLFPFTDSSANFIWLAKRTGSSKYESSNVAGDLCRHKNQQCCYTDDHEIQCSTVSCQRDHEAAWATLSGNDDAFCFCVTS